MLNVMWAEVPLCTACVPCCYKRHLSNTAACQNLRYNKILDQMIFLMSPYSLPCSPLFQCSPERPTCFSLLHSHNEAECAGSRLSRRSAAILERAGPIFVLCSRKGFRSIAGFASHTTMKSGLAQQTFALTRGSTCTRVMAVHKCFPCALYKVSNDRAVQA